MSDTAADADPLLRDVLAALGDTMGFRAYLHPSRPGKVAVRGVLWDACAVVLEAAGFPVEREPGWLTVSAR